MLDLDAHASPCTDTVDTARDVDARPLLLVVHVDSFYNATGRVGEVVRSGDSAGIRERVAIGEAFARGVTPQQLEFDVYESFEGGPAHVTRGWRFEPPPTWDQIVQSMEETNQQVVA